MINNSSFIQPLYYMVFSMSPIKITIMDNTLEGILLHMVLFYPIGYILVKNKKGASPFIFLLILSRGTSDDLINDFSQAD